MGKLALLIGIITLLSLQIVAQHKAKALKIAEFNDRTESTKAFIAKTESLIKQVLKSPKTTRAFIAIDGKNILTILRLRKIARDLFIKNKVNEYNFDVSHPYTGYNEIFNTTEFWLIPKGAEPPYVPITGDCFCTFASLKVSGIENADMKTKVLLFSATGNDWPGEFTVYNWSVAGGTISEGQGTSRITVRVNEIAKSEITATVAVQFIDNPCDCPNTAKFTTALGPK